MLEPDQTAKDSGLGAARVIKLCYNYTLRKALISSPLIVYIQVEDRFHTNLSTMITFSDMYEKVHK